MPLVHQQNQFDFFIEPGFQEPPHMLIAKGEGFIIIRIGVPEKELPHFDKHKNVSREELDLIFDIVNDNQEKFLGAWGKIHNH